MKQTKSANEVKVDSVKCLGSIIYPSSVVEIVKPLLLLLSVCSPALALPGDERFSVGLKGGYQWSLDSAYIGSNPNAGIVGVYGLYRFSDAFSLELGYQHHLPLHADKTNVRVQTNFIESAARYDWSMSNGFSAYGRLGAAHWSAAKSVEAAGKNRATGLAPLGEVGVSYRYRSGLILSAGIQHIHRIGSHELGRYNSNAVVVGFSYALGSKSRHVHSYTFPKPLEVSHPVVEIDGPLELVSVEPEALAPTTTAALPHDLRILYQVNAIKPGPEYNLSLDKFVSYLHHSPQEQVLIVGHADSTGTTAYNQLLSKARAPVVANHFLAAGVAQSQIALLAKGEMQPVADNATRQGRALNRRDDVMLVDASNF